MADLSDGEAALAAFVVSTLYPEGLRAASITGQQVRVYRGWPLTGPLGVDLSSGIANISVFAIPGATRNTTRWAPTTQTTRALSTLTVVTVGNSATFGGLGGQGQLAGLLVDNQPFVYRGQAADTPALVAAVLAGYIRAVRSCWLSGASLSVPGAIRLLGRVTADGRAQTEWTRQGQAFRISAWCPNPGIRDMVCSSLGSAFAATSFIDLADGTAGRVRYRSTSSFDDDQDAQLYRRDLVYDVEYSTSTDVAAPSMLFGDLLLSGANTYG